MKRMRLLIIGCGIIALASVCRADTVDYVVIGPGGLDDCTFSQRPGFFTVIATLNLSAPAKSLQMTTWQSCPQFAISWNYPVSGDPNTLMTVDFGGCISGSVALFTASGTVDGCCPALINATYVPSAPPMLIGCDDQPRVLIPPCSASAPVQTAPGDGATVAISPTLTWSYSFGQFCEYLIGVPAFVTRYGTDPNNLDHMVGTNDTPQLTLPGLAPATQYFWQVRVWDEYAYYTGSWTNMSAVQSFTTEGTVAATPTTWGAVKALFGD